MMAGKKGKWLILHVTKISHLIFPCRSLIHTGGIDLFFGLIGDGQKKNKIQNFGFYFSDLINSVAEPVEAIGSWQTTKASTLR